mgnify:CR=1 FL=1
MHNWWNRVLCSAVLAILAPLGAGCGDDAPTDTGASDSGMDGADAEAHAEELGDLLFQIVFQSHLREDQGTFQLADVVDAIAEKLIRRHPHVFGDSVINSAQAQTASWEALKAEERQHKNQTSALDGVTTGLPALTRALKLQKRAARVGFDWHQATDVLAKFSEEVAELAHEMETGGDTDRLQDELGDLLFTCVNLARKLEIDPETALRHGNAKFERRFHMLEVLLQDKYSSPEQSSLDQMENLWPLAKSRTAR